ncbi:transmembrane domain-containing protein [Saccharibacillus sacchari]|uniref:Transmembrane domain-containing protein n=1 Tax=Saccharibacillus sacchari TaxID=456493 RepID=A0ACC6PHM4_9BACL
MKGTERFTNLFAEKKVLRLYIPLLLLACGLLLSACAQGEVDVTIKTDGTADIKMNATIDESALSTIGQTDLPEQIASSLREQGLDAQAITEGGQAGISASRTVQLDSGTLPELPDGITVEDRKEEGLFTTTHHYVIVADPPELIPRESSSLTGFIGSRLLSRFVDNEFDFRFKLTLPIKPGENNADTVSDDGRTLTWNLAATRENRIELELAVPNIQRIVIAASAVLVVLIALIVFVVLRRKRKKKPLPSTPSA